MFGWNEVYLCTCKEDFEQAKNKLDNCKIKYNVKIKNDAQRLSMNNLDGRQAALSRGGFASNTYYYIYVKKENIEFAKECLNREEKG